MKKTLRLAPSVELLLRCRVVKEEAVQTMSVLAFVKRTGKVNVLVYLMQVLYWA